MSDLTSLRSDPSFRSLAGEIAKGECVIFVGAGLSIAAGLPSWSQLETILREKAGITQPCGAPRAADCCRAVIGEKNFNALIQSHIKRGELPTAAHRRLAGLPVGIFVTTNYDTLLEQAVEEESRYCKVLSLGDTAEWAQIRDAPAERLVLKIHGCISRTPTELVITEDDYLSFSSKYEALVLGLSSLLSRRPILFLGYSFSDWNLLSILHDVQRITTGNGTNKYYLGVDLEPSLERFLERRHGLFVFNVATETTKEQAILKFFDALAQEYDIPRWLRKMLLELGGNRAPQEIERATPLATLFPVFDAVTRMRLALRIERHEGIQLPMNEVIRGKTIGDLVDLVYEQKQAPNAGA